MSQVIVITSGKGGVGKSNICINTALSLSSMNYQTCLFDADLGLANANILLGLDQEFTLDDVIFNDKELKDIVLNTRWGFDIIPGSSGVEKIANLNAYKLDQLVQSFSKLTDYDYFLIDTASGISRNVISFCLASHETIIVLTPEATSLTDAYALLKVLDTHNYQGSVRILVNNCTTAQLAKKTYTRFKKVVDNHLSLSVSPAGIILRDSCFEKAVSYQRPLLEIYPQSVAATCIHAFVSNMVEKWDIGSSKSSLKAFWKRYLQICSPKIETDIEEPESPYIAAGQESPTVHLPTGAETEPTNEGNDHSVEEVPGEEKETLPDVPSTPPIPSTEPVNLDKLLYTEETASAPFSANIETGMGRTEMTAPGYIEQQSSSTTETKLRSPEHILHAAFQLISKGNLTGLRATNLILSDPILTLQTLKLASLTVPSYAHKGINIQKFLETVNVSKIRSMLLKGVVDYVFSQSPPLDESSHFQFWHHSKYCAELAQEIALNINYPCPDDAYLCGLLLNIGKLPDISPATEDVDIDHAITGAEILKSLPVNTMICDGIRFHHYPEEQIQTAFDLVRIVYVANCLSKEQLPEQNHAELLTGITIEELKTLQERARQRVQQTRERYNSRSGNLRQQIMNYLFMQGIMPPISTANHFSDCLQPVFNSIQTLFGYRNIICFLLDPDNNTLEVEGASGDILHEQTNGMRVPMEIADCLLVRALTTGDIQLFDPLATTEASCLMDQQLNRILDNSGMICLPLNKEDDDIGVLVCGIDRQDLESFTDKREQLLQLATQVTHNLSILSRIIPPAPISDLEN